MTENVFPSRLSRPLSIGNVVSAGLQIYRRNFGRYLSLALTAHLWLVVPVYGWIQFFEISAFIAGLTFSELTEQVESYQTIFRQVKCQSWRFLVTNILVFLLSLVSVVVTIVFLLLLTIMAATAIVFTVSILKLPHSHLEALGHLLGVLLGIAILVLFPLTIFWTYSRFFLTELLLGSQKGSGLIAAIRRSWNLTKGSVFYLPGVMTVTFVLVISLFISIQSFGFLIAWFSTRFSANPYQAYSNLSSILSIVLVLVFSVLTMPLWQAVKAASYYSLLSRREGFGLGLRDR